MVKNLLKACFMMAALTAAGQAAAETYTVGSGGTYRPFEFENSQKQLEGFDIDIIKAIAKAEGFDVKLVNTPMGRHLRHAEHRRPRHHHLRDHHHR